MFILHINIFLTNNFLRNRKILVKKHLNFFVN